MTSLQVQQLDHVLFGIFLVTLFIFLIKLARDTFRKEYTRGWTDAVSNLSIREKLRAAAILMRRNKVGQCPACKKDAGIDLCPDGWHCGFCGKIREVDLEKANEQ